MFELRRSYRIQSAHQLPTVPAAHPCARLHGHTYTIEIMITGELEPDTGWVMDYGEIDAAAEPVLARLDHRHLNDIEGLENPTSEHLARWIWERLSPALPALTQVSVAENPACACVYRGVGR